MAVAMGLGLGGLVIIGVAVVLEIDDVTERGEKYQVEAITKLESLAELRNQIGLGSVVDQLHQYQTSPDSAHAAQLAESLRLARTNLDAYRLAGQTTPAEEQALAQVSGALDLIGDGSILPPPATNLADLQAAGQSLGTLDRLISASNTALAEANVDELQHLRWLTLAGGGLAASLLAFVTGAVVWQSRRRVVEPLARLLSESRRLAALQLDKPFDWPLHDELGELGRTLDGTRRTLRDLLAENEERTKRLAHLATHDPLTGLANRAKLIEWLGERMQGGRPSSLALLFLDLDHFKMVNDSLGHSIGDKLLVAIAERLTALFQPGERVARLGGDAFVVVIDLAGGMTAKVSASKIEAAFAKPFAVDGMELSITTGIGIAVDDGQREVPEDLLRDADIALYRAKEAGRGQTQIFDMALREAVLVRHRLHSDLDAAIAHDEVFVVYQPIVRLGPNQVSGFESLIRWRHPDLGLISPVHFVPIAEETGGILKLGRHVLESAVRDLALLQQDWPAPLSVNVNFSPRQMWDENHVSEMLARLGESDCAQVKIEVTESLAMTNPDSACDILRRFSALGVPLCIDDFGTGYSSLSYLGRFPFTILKLDKSFVAGLTGGDAGQGRLIKGVINLAHDLGLEVVAEGIELEQERAILTSMGCDYGQGYLFAKPLKLSDAQEFLKRAMP
jgi:diguanylate cyclase (GGDEF)-like protein